LLHRDRIVLSLILTLILVVPARAQFYQAWHRPVDVRYSTAASPHFRLIYQAGLENEAAELAELLERELPALEATIGLKRPLRMPVVLNRFTDRGNGLVTPTPFRQEIETAPHRGNTLSPRFPSWFETVAPHELVHAVHAESGSGFGVGWLLRRLGPDLARSLNLSAPRGINEGLAVWYESRRRPGAGRLHHSLFEMEFRAAMQSGRPWSLAQMLEPPSYSFPIDRYYHGGAHLLDLLERRDGDLSAFRRARDFYYRFPLLGFGVALWYGARMSPHSLGRQLRSEYRSSSGKPIDVEGHASPNIISSERGVVYRRPTWLDDGTLLVYARGYHLRPGFYTVDVRTGQRRRLAHEAISEDYLFNTDRDTASVLFTRYVPDRLEPLRQVSAAYRMDLRSGRASRITSGHRTHAAVESPHGTLWATQGDGQYNVWVEIDDTGESRRLARFPGSILKSIQPSPTGEHTIALVNVEGRQGLFEVVGNEDGFGLAPLVLFRDGSVFDFSWGPQGEYIVFSADPGGKADLFAVEVATRAVFRLSDVAFGAIEPSLSSDRRTVAFIHYRHEAYELAQIPFELDHPVEDGLLMQADEVITASGNGRAAVNPHTSANAGLARSGRYRPLLEMRPRVAIPYLVYQRPTSNDEDVHLGLGVGLGLEWSDPLQYWVAHTSALYRVGTVWGRVALRTGRFLVRTSAEAFREPSTVVIRRIDGEQIDTVRVGRDERGIGLSVGLPAVLEANVFQTRAEVRLAGEFIRESLFDAEGDHGPSTDAVTLRPAAELSYRMQSNVRDIVPNSGLRISGFGRLDAWSSASSAARYARIRTELYLPWLRKLSTGIMLNGSLHTQNRGSIVDLTTFFPRGYETDAEFLGRGTYWKAGLEVTQPLWYIDNGFFLLPVYFRAVFVYGFVERMETISNDSPSVTVVGAGMGVQLRVIHNINVTLRAAPVYRFREQDWAITLR